jgi:hypothetical protein
MAQPSFGLTIKQRLENFRPLDSAATAIFAVHKQARQRLKAQELSATRHNEKRLNMIFLLYDIFQINCAQLAAGLQRSDINSVCRIVQLFLAVF